MYVVSEVVTGVGIELSQTLVWTAKKEIEYLLRLANVISMHRKSCTDILP